MITKSDLLTAIRSDPDLAREAEDHRSSIGRHLSLIPDDHDVTVLLQQRIDECRAWAAGCRRDADDHDHHAARLQALAARLTEPAGTVPSPEPH